MTERSSTPSHPLPETGSEHGIHLRGGAFRGARGLEPPPEFLGGGLYCIYPRAFAADGSLRSVLPELDRIVDLGCRSLWFLPIHPVGVLGRKGSRGSPYSIRDYRAVASEYGTREDFVAVVRAAKERGLRVILDFVANHAANDHPAFREHPGWLAVDREGRPTRRLADWSDIADWIHDAPGAAEHLIESAAEWIREAGLDGFRCDVAGMVPRWFWVRLRERLLAERPGHFLLAEWQDPALHAAAFHACYDWATYRAMRDVARGDANAVAVTAALGSWGRHFPDGAIPLRFLENHDEPRILSYLDAGRLPAFAAVSILSGGLPLVYNGQEIGATAYPSLFEAEPVEWGEADPAVTALYRDLLRLQAGGPPWNVGALRLLENDRPRSVVAFLRPGARRGLVVANLGSAAVRVRPRLPFGDTAAYRRRPPGTGSFRAGETLSLAAGEAWIGETG